MNQAYDAVLLACSRALGDDLHSAFRYSSAGDAYFQPHGSAPALLLVIADSVDMETLREVISPLWEEHGDRLQRPPLVATPRSLERHLRLFPLLAHHLAHTGERLAGKRLLTKGSVQLAHPAERAAYLSWQAMEASAALAPDLLPAARAEAAGDLLRRLARYLAGVDGESTATLFAQVQRSVQTLIEDLPSGRKRTATADGGEPVQAVYEETDNVVVVTPVLAAETVRAMAWGDVDGRLQQPGMGLHVTTAEQLRLALLLEKPLHVALDRYQHLHGRDVLQGMAVPTRAVWRHGARVPSTLLIEEVPGAYVTAGDDEARHMVVHDYQNRLLNMRLQHELLHRLHDFEPAAPPEPLPGKEASLAERINAILNHLAWWADYCTEAMKETPAGSRLQAP